MGKDTYPRLFIIESDDVDAEGTRSEGTVLREVLRMMEREPIDHYRIRTSQELRVMAALFEQSKCRYLHISCHGTRNGFALAFDTVSYREFANIFRPVLRDRRLFLSACGVAKPALARELFADAGRLPYSITGPSRTIEFADAAVTWAALYNLLFRGRDEVIKGRRLRTCLDRLCRLNGVKFAHFGRSSKKASNFRSYWFPKRR